MLPPHGVWLIEASKYLGAAQFINGSVDVKWLQQQVIDLVIAKLGVFLVTFLSDLAGNHIFLKVVYYFCPIPLTYYHICFACS